MEKQKKPNRSLLRFEKEAKALQKNLEKRKKQQESRQKMREDKENG